MRYSALTETGKVRDNNEDSYHVDERTFIVADGMGGHRAGEVASSAAIEEFLRFEEANASLEPVDRMREGILAANRELYAQAMGDTSLEGMGTTFTAVLVEGEVFMGHVGDSRAYLWRDGGLRLLTRDHSLVERMVQEGRITRTEARNHPHRNIILRALGVSDQVQVDMRSYAAAPGDRLLLCSDGLTESLEDGEIARILCEFPDLDECCRALVDVANDRGGTDNITVVLVEFEEGDVIDGKQGKKGGWWRGIFSSKKG
ncbi:MAG: Stp1/IreP family PP2C-type Ser/Thr phosphatase [Actinomycetota bacterium]|nr:Stp1/IreP family PP2C-type Ser/Thr phosphatase [Actinomycetota bacterium]